MRIELKKVTSRCNKEEAILKTNGGKAEVGAFDLSREKREKGMKMRWKSHDRCLVNKVIEILFFSHRP